MKNESCTARPQGLIVQGADLGSIRGSNPLVSMELSAVINHSCWATLVFQSGADTEFRG